jgi:hypothetical protein
MVKSKEKGGSDHGTGNKNLLRQARRDSRQKPAKAAL